MKKTTNFDAFAQFADARLSKEEMKMIKGGTEPRDFESGDTGTGGSGTGGGNVSQGWTCTWIDRTTRKTVQTQTFYGIHQGDALSICGRNNTPDFTCSGCI